MSGGFEEEISCPYRVSNPFTHRAARKQVPGTSFRFTSKYLELCRIVFLWRYTTTRLKAREDYIEYGNCICHANSHFHNPLICNDSVRTSQRTQCASITMTNVRMWCIKTMAVYYQNNIEQKKKEPAWEKCRILNVKLRGRACVK
jgi:hypothetical protein